MFWEGDGVGVDLNEKKKVMVNRKKILKVKESTLKLRKNEVHLLQKIEIKKNSKSIKTKFGVESYMKVFRSYILIREM